MEVELLCKGRGIPAPTVRMYHQGLSLTSESHDPSIAQKRLVVNQATVGEYYCLASNTIVPPEGGKRPQLAHRIIVLEMISECKIL